MVVGKIRGEEIEVVGVADSDNARGVAVEQ